MKTTENGENIYKMMNAWLRNCRSILAYMTKEIKDTKRETGRKMLGEQLLVFNSIFMNNKGPSHALKGRTFFSLLLLKRSLYNMILHH